MIGLHRKCGAAFVFVGLLSVLGVACSFGQAPAARVLTPGESVQVAIDAAREGDVLVLSPGAYVENIVVEKDLVLRGGGDAPGAVEISASQRGPVLRVRGTATVRIENLTLTRGLGFEEGFGLRLEGSVAVALSRVISRSNFWAGIRVGGESRLTAADCEIYDNGTSGFYIDDFSNVTLERCRIERNVSHGIVVLHDADVLVRNSTIAGQLTGLWLWDGSRTRVEACEIRENRHFGTACWNAALLRIERSKIVENGDSGLLFPQSTRGVVRDCEISRNGDHGILIREDAIMEVSRCTIAGNGQIGIQTGALTCVGEYDPARPFKGRVFGGGNVIPGPEVPGGNGLASLCPSYPGELWTEGFLGQP